MGGRGTVERRRRDGDGRSMRACTGSVSYALSLPLARAVRRRRRRRRRRGKTVGLANTRACGCGEARRQCDRGGGTRGARTARNAAGKTTAAAVFIRRIVPRRNGTRGPRTNRKGDDRVCQNPESGGGGARQRFDK